MSVTEVSRRYAKALLALTKQKGIHNQALSELKTIDAIIRKDEDVREYFQNPLVSPDQKFQVVKAAFGSVGLLEENLSLLMLLSEKGRISELSSIVEAYQLRLDEEEGLTRGTVRAAKPLSSEAMQDLETRISGTLKKKIVLTFKEDVKILGGVIAEVGGWTFDDSIETHLRKMNEELKRSSF